MWTKWSRIRISVNRTDKPKTFSPFLAEFWLTDNWKLAWDVVVFDRDDCDKRLQSYVDISSRTPVIRSSSWPVSDHCDPVQGRLHRWPSLCRRRLELASAQRRRFLLDSHRRRRSSTVLLRGRHHPVRTGETLSVRRRTRYHGRRSVCFNGLFHSK